MVKLIRTECNLNGIFGFIMICDHFFCYTLEHSYEGKSKVPTGLYTCTRGNHILKSGKSIETFEVMNVPGHSGILFHYGNYNSDSDGCILLGYSETPLMVKDSCDAFQGFMKEFDGIDSFTLMVENDEL